MSTPTPPANSATPLTCTTSLESPAATAARSPRRSAATRSGSHRRRSRRGRQQQPSTTPLPFAARPCPVSLLRHLAPRFASYHRPAGRSRPDNLAPSRSDERPVICARLLDSERLQHRRRDVGEDAAVPAQADARGRQDRGHRVQRVLRCSGSRPARACGRRCRGRPSRRRRRRSRGPPRRPAPRHRRRSRSPSPPPGSRPCARPCRRWRS